MDVLVVALPSKNRNGLTDDVFDLYWTEVSAIEGAIVVGADWEDLVGRHSVAACFHWYGLAKVVGLIN